MRSHERSEQGRERPNVELKKGDTVDGLRILAELGRGAASIIYLVQDLKSKHVWALKRVTKHDAKDQRFLDQAEAEYRVSQSLDHPCIRKITRVIKKGSFLSTRELFLVMELVDGVSLERSPPRTFERAVRIFEQVAGALGHMHERGWVHADMKPNNIMADADGEHVKVIDLGQSCKIGTVKPRIQGTPDYIAPEQVHRREITPRTDVYNLGASMYWVLTRQHIPTALAGEDKLVGSIDDSLIERPTPAIELNPKIHPRLNELIMQCVEVKPEDRPADMRFVEERLNLVRGILVAQGANVPRDDASINL